MTVKPVTIMAAILTTHERAGWLCPALSDWKDHVLQDNLLKVMHGQPIHYSIMFGKLHNFIPAASARNFFADYCKNLDPRPDWIMMVDNDMGPGDNILDCLRDAPEDADIVVPRFVMWDEGKPRISLCWGMDAEIVPEQDGHQIFTVEPGNYYPLTKCGTGVIFIKPHVFDKIEMPYFWYSYNEQGGMIATEDINFCNKVKAAGLKIYGAGGYDVGHWHNVNLSVLAKLVDDTRKGLDTEAKLGNKEQVELTDDLRLDSVATARPVVVA